MRQPNIFVYGSQSCPDTRRALESLDTHQIAYELKDVDDFPEYNEYIASLNNGTRVTPTIRIDNHTLINPTESELVQAVERAAAERG